MLTCVLHSHMRFTQSSAFYIVTCVLYNVKIVLIINFEFEYLSGLHHVIEL